MKALTKILCVVEPNNFEQPAVDRAVWLAEKTGAKLELFSCYYHDSLSSSRYFSKDSLADLRANALNQERDYLDDLASRYHDRNIDIATHVDWDYPVADGITRRAIKSKADIVFKETRPRGIVASLTLSNIDWNLIRGLPMPLWFVRPGQLPEPPVFLTAVDPLHEHDKPASLDHKLLDVSAFLSEKTNALQHVFHAYDTSAARAGALPGTHAPIPLSIDQIESNIRDLHQEHFSALAKTYGLPEIRQHLVSGQAKNELPTVAEALNASVVIMGAVARNAWERIFIGSTAEKVADKIHCDLLIVKSDQFKTDVSLLDEDEQNVA